MLPPALRDADSIFDVIAKRDVLLHHPYESFEPVVRFIEEAADDPNVLAIKQTLYRTSGDSPFVRALSRAAENGKQVTALVEIKARFDEANNIDWARALEENGVHVVYGLRRPEDALQGGAGGAPRGRRHPPLRAPGHRQLQPADGARSTPICRFFTARPEIAEDASALFNLLTGYSEPPHVEAAGGGAARSADAASSALIDREAERAKRGEPARIIAKMNALVDPAIIRALYARQPGGRGDRSDRARHLLPAPGRAGRLASSIRVTSVVDRFLEHSRVFAFGAGERIEVCSSRRPTGCRATSCAASR